MTEGTKYDAGKPMVNLVIEGFPRALLEVAKVATFGAEKYEPGNWQYVQDGVNRYQHAAGRHQLKRCSGEVLDDESGLYHEAHEIWSRLAAFELRLREQENIVDPFAEDAAAELDNPQSNVDQKQEHGNTPEPSERRREGLSQRLKKDSAADPVPQKNMYVLCPKSPLFRNIFVSDKASLSYPRPLTTYSLDEAALFTEEEKDNITINRSEWRWEKVSKQNRYVLCTKQGLFSKIYLADKDTLYSETPSLTPHISKAALYTEDETYRIEVPSSPPRDWWWEDALSYMVQTL